MINWKYFPNPSATAFKYGEFFGALHVDRKKRKTIKSIEVHMELVTNENKTRKEADAFDNRSGFEDRRFVDPTHPAIGKGKKVPQKTIIHWPRSLVEASCIPLAGSVGDTIRAVGDTPIFFDWVWDDGLIKSRFNNYYFDIKPRKRHRVPFLLYISYQLKERKEHAQHNDQ